MKKMHYVVGVILMILVFSGSLVCSANESQDRSEKDILVIVVDKSKESYGIQNEVFSQIKKQLKAGVSSESELLTKSNDYGDIAKTEKSQLLELADKTGSNQVLIVEILPIKSDFTEIVFYKALKAESTLRVRLYDARGKQYVLTEEASGVETNKTFIPYTSVGKKRAALKAVHKAVDIAVQAINQQLRHAEQQYDEKQTI
ncbi:MAG: hypothetical protein ACRDBM_09925 [Sporomusa sp.]